VTPACISWNVTSPKGSNPWPVTRDCRFGEVAALRWCDYDRTQKPLGLLSVHFSYDIKTKKLKGVKTEVPRRVPVHPTLAKLHR
jgi:integrase